MSTDAFMTATSSLLSPESQNEVFVRLKEAENELVELIDALHLEMGRFTSTRSSNAFDEQETRKLPEQNQQRRHAICCVLDKLIGKVLMTCQQDFNSVLEQITFARGAGRSPSRMSRIGTTSQSASPARGSLGTGGPRDESLMMVSACIRQFTGSGDMSELAKTKIKELQRKCTAKDETIAAMERKIQRREADTVKLRVGFLKQLQHLKEMAHRKETAPNFTYLEVKFFSAQDGFDQDMVFLLNSRLEEARDEYNRRLIGLQKTNCHIKEKVEHFQTICADGNYGIPFRQMGTQSIIRKLSIIENNPLHVWKAIQQYFGSGFFNDVILRQYDIQTEGQNDFSTDINYQLNQYQRKAKQHISSISKQTQVEVTLLRRYLRDKENQIAEMRTKCDEIAERIRTEERMEAEIKLKEQEEMLKEKFELEKEQLKTTIVRKVSSTSTVDADKIKLKMALTKWWFKGKLITIKNKDRKEREHLIEEAENALHKMEIKQMAQIQQTILELRQENYQLNKSIAENAYEMSTMKRQVERKQMELEQLEGEMCSIRGQYKETLDERIQLQNTSTQLCESVEAQKEYINNMEKQIFDLEQWIKRVCSVQKSLKPPKTIMSKTKKRHIAETINKKAIQDLYNSSVQALGRMESEGGKDKETLTLLNGLDTELDLVVGERVEKPALAVETQTNLVYMVEEQAQTGDELLSALRSKILPPEPKPSTKGSKMKTTSSTSVGGSVAQKRQIERLQGEVGRLKDQVLKLKNQLRQEKDLMLESSRSIQVEKHERQKLQEMLKQEQQARRKTDMTPTQHIFSRIEVPTSHQSSQTVDDEAHSPRRKQSEKANATIQTEQSQQFFDGKAIFSGDKSPAKSKLVLNLATRLGLDQVVEKQDSKQLSQFTMSPLEQISGPQEQEEMTILSAESEIKCTQSQAVGGGDSLQQPSQSPWRVSTSPSPQPVEIAAPTPSTPQTQTRMNVSRLEQRPVFKVVPYNLDVFQRFLQRQAKGGVERAVQTIVGGSVRNKLKIDKSGTSLVDQMVNCGLRKSIDLRQISRNRQSRGKLKTLKTPLNRAMEELRMMTPSPADSTPLTNFITTVSDMPTWSPKMLVTPKTDVSTPMSGQTRQDRQSGPLITISEHQKLKLGGGMGRQSPLRMYSLTNMSLIEASGDDKQSAGSLFKQQSYAEKRKEHVRRFNYQIKKSMRMMDRKKQKSLDETASKPKPFKTVIANQGRRFVLQDEPACMVPLYRHEGSTSVESTRDMLLLESQRSARRHKTTIKFESPPIVQPLQLSELADSEAQISIAGD